jgi:hypothetical protein
LNHRLRYFGAHLFSGQRLVWLLLGFRLSLLRCDLLRLLLRLCLLWLAAINGRRSTEATAAATATVAQHGSQTAAAAKRTK